MELTIMEERNTRNKQTKRIPYFTNCRVDFMLFLIVNICRLLQNVTASTEKTQRLASYLITLRQDVKELVKLLLQCISKVRGMVRVKSSLVRQMIRKDKDSPWLLFCFEIWQVLEIWTKEDFFSVGQTLQLLVAQNFLSFSQGWDKQDPSSGEQCRHFGSPKGCALESSSLKEAALSGFWISRPMVIFSVPGNRISAVTLPKAQESSLYKLQFWFYFNLIWMRHPILI